MFTNGSITNFYAKFTVGIMLVDIQIYLLLMKLRNNISKLAGAVKD